jgi:SAM-dependent methyltransferase
MNEPSQPSDRLIEWTGERCVPWVDDWQVLYEHLHRYFFAADLADGKRVLDLGSGEGYGSAILAERAKSVLAVELDPEAVRHASGRYPAENLEFRQGSVLELDDLADASFDLVVCYEVIEHITEHDGLLALARRVLAPDGLFLLSTPDREIYSEAADYHNPYHVKELSRPEFDELLARFFAHHALWGQVITVGSTLQRLDPAPGAPEVGDSGSGSGGPAVEEIFVRGEGEHWVRHQPQPVPYLVAVASQTELVPLPELSLLNDSGVGALRAPPLPAPPEGAAVPSLAEEVTRILDGESGRQFELWDPERLRRLAMLFEAALVGEMKANQVGRAEIADLRAAVESITAALEAARADAAEARAGANADVASARHAVERADSELASLRAQTEEITGSRAWRAVTRYRRFRVSLSGRSRTSGA